MMGWPPHGYGEHDGGKALPADIDTGQRIGPQPLSWVLMFSTSPMKNC